ncbi:MAG TPA: hypothetical protein VJ227_01525 [Patescibacteria group bacterium]|nr:hypothetical protein [Patescibacteria group bacterium]
MKDLFTIVYYTSNRESPAFEEKIREKLLGVSGDIPIISVSQKPIDFGKNICVGDVGACDANLFRQIQIGCEAAKTPFVISAEADTLYPPDYFQFVPRDENEYYRFDNLYVLSQWGKGEYAGFYKKDTAPFAQIAGRALYIRMIKKALEGNPLWNDPKKRIRIPLFLDHPWKIFHNTNPIINLKTFSGMRVRTKTSGSSVASLPYWGSANDLRVRVWG